MNKILIFIFLFIIGNFPIVYGQNVYGTHTHDIVPPPVNPEIFKKCCHDRDCKIVFNIKLFKINPDPIDKKGMWEITILQEKYSTPVTFIEPGSIIYESQNQYEYACIMELCDYGDDDKYCTTVLLCAFVHSLY